MAFRFSPVFRYTVKGKSMYPEYRQGDWVLVNRLAYFFSSPEPGDDVVFHHPVKDDMKLIKRIDRVSGSRCYVRGCNDDFSTDSRDFGPVDQSDIVGKIVYKGG